MNPGSSSLLAMERAGDNSQSVYIPMSPGPHHLDPLGYPSAALPMHRGPSRGSEIQPPPVNRNLKPDRKGKSALSHLWTKARYHLLSLSDQVDPELYLQGSGSLWATYTRFTLIPVVLHPGDWLPSRLMGRGVQEPGQDRFGVSSATCSRVTADQSFRVSEPCFFTGETGTAILLPGGTEGHRSSIWKCFVT